MLVAPRLHLCSVRLGKRHPRDRLGNEAMKLRSADATRLGQRQEAANSDAHNLTTMQPTDVGSNNRFNS